MLADHGRVHVSQIRRFRHVICVAAETGEREGHENSAGYQKRQPANDVDQKSCERYIFLNIIRVETYLTNIFDKNGINFITLSINL